MVFPVRPRPEVAADLAALGDDDLRAVALALLAELESHPYLGRSLTGNLGDCRTIHFDRPDVEVRPGYRVVYRLRPTESEPTEIDVICVGERADLAVYRSPRARQGR